MFDCSIEQPSSSNRACEKATGWCYIEETCNAGCVELETTADDVARSGQQRELWPSQKAICDALKPHESTVSVSKPKMDTVASALE